MSTTYPYAEPKDAKGRPVFYARFRTLRTASGDPLQVQTTRYTWQIAKRPVTGPRGGRNYQEFARTVYYAGGVFYRARNYQDAQGRWYNGLEPVTGTIWDAHPLYTQQRGDAPSVSIRCSDGQPVMACDAEACYWQRGEGIGYLEQLLHLDRKPRTRKAA